MWLRRAQLRSAPLLPRRRLGAASRGRAGRGQRGWGARIRGVGAEGSAPRLPGAPCSAAPQLPAPAASLLKMSVPIICAPKLTARTSGNESRLLQCSVSLGLPLAP